MQPDTMYDYRPEQKKRVEADKCSLCAGNIYVGDMYYDFGGEVICEECLDEYVGYFKKEAD